MDVAIYILKELQALGSNECQDDAKKKSRKKKYFFSFFVLHFRLISVTGEEKRKIINHCTH